MNGDYAGAQVNFKKGDGATEKIGDIVSYSYTLWSLGKTCTMLGKPDKAMEYF